MIGEAGSDSNTPSCFMMSLESTPGSTGYTQKNRIMFCGLRSMRTGTLRVRLILTASDRTHVLRILLILIILLQ